jgi:hypothetical protein
MLAAGLGVFLYYWMVVTDGRPLNVQPTRYGLVFNNMLDHLLRGQFDIDPSFIGKEGFTRNGHVYAYFGIMPALLRLPLALFSRLDGADVTALSCAVAATSAAVAEIMAIRYAGRLLPSTRYGTVLTALLILACVLGGPQVQFLRPSMYQEPTTWAAALAAIFVLLLFRWCTDVAGREAWHLVAMAVLAGVCLNTRVSTSIGLYAGCGALIGIEGVRWLRGHGARTSAITPRSLSLAVCVLLAFMLVCGVVNDQRWGNPLTFQDYRYYNTVSADDAVHEMIREYGFFNLQRIPFALGYYFLPLWAIIRPDGAFLFKEAQHRLFFLVEPPPTSFLLSDLALCGFAAVGAIWLARPGRGGFDIAASRLSALGLSLPGLLMLTAMAVAFRYRAEFYQAFLFLALYGRIGIGRWLGRWPRLVIGGVMGCVAVSLVGAHLNLAAYKVTPWGDYLPVEQTGWVKSYRAYAADTYPTLFGDPHPEVRPAPAR